MGIEFNVGSFPKEIPPNYKTTQKQQTDSTKQGITTHHPYLIQEDVTVTGANYS